MSWINATVSFGDRYASFKVPLRELYDLGVILNSDPEKAEAWFQAFLAKRRPDLRGGWLLAIDFDFPDACWRFLYMHKSFANVPIGQRPPAIDLFDEETITPDVTGKTG